MEGAWHGTYDYACVSCRPPLDRAGPKKTLRKIPGSAGFVKGDIIKNTLVAPFNDSDAMEKIVNEQEGPSSVIIQRSVGFVSWIVCACNVCWSSAAV
jgi:glutamate-1-semialdehyde aminotransferase